MLNSTFYRANQLWQTLPSEIKTVLHYHFLRTKSKLDTVTDVNVKFAQGTSPMYIISSFTSAP